MSYQADIAILERYMPLISAELRRIGVSEEDERWIHAGTNQRPTEELAEAELAALRTLPNGMGVRAYCKWLGFDYDETKRWVTASHTVKEMWMLYCASLGQPDAPLPPIWHFCDTEEDADECARLVLAGRKRATAPSLWGLQHRGEPIPAVGDLDLVTTWDGEACAIIRTAAVTIVPFHAVTAKHAAAEGEGDASLSWWRQVHWEYYKRELAGTPYQPSEDMSVVCQYFEVVYPEGVPGGFTGIPGQYV